MHPDIVLMTAAFDPTGRTLAVGCDNGNLPPVGNA